MPDERREIEREPVPAELEAALPEVPNSEPEHLPDEPVVQDDLIETVRPCKVCGVSLEGEHPRRQTCKLCQDAKALKRTRDHVVAQESLPEEEKAGALGFVMPRLVIVDGENPDITGWVVSIYKLLKHHFGLSKNGISMVLGSFRSGAPISDVVGLYAEMVKSLSSLEFAEESIKIGLICDALEKCLGKDINLKMKAF